jgi:DnaK suppressor protein
MAARRSTSVTSRTVLTTSPDAASPDSASPEFRLTVRQSGPLTESPIQSPIQVVDGAGAPPARPGEAPWSSDEVEAVRAEILTELENLDREVAILESNVASVMYDSGDGAGDDHADTGSKAYGREQEFAFLTSTRRTLVETRQALARMEKGTYGVCESCGRAVGKLRLQAFPRATLCLPCKQGQERR